MKRPLIWVSVFAAVVAVTSVVLDPTQVVVGKLFGEAFFQRRPTRFWARSLEAGPGERADALSALEQGGADAIPVLTGMLTGRSAADKAELRYTAAEVLSKLGPDAADAGPALTAGAQDGDSHVQAVCAAALPKVGVAADVAVPPLTKLLKTEQAVVAARALSEYRGAAAAALPALVELLLDRSRGAEARWNAARAIGKMGPDAVSALPALIEALDDGEWTIREHSAESIGDVGPAGGRESAAALIRTLADPVVRVRRDAIRSLGQIGEAALEAVPALAGVLTDSSADDEAELRWTAAEVIANFGPKAAAAGPALVAGVQDGDSHVQTVCASALPKVGVRAEEAVPVLAELLETDHAAVAARALSEYRDEAAAALPALVKLLQEESRGADARWNAARTIGKIGPAAASAVPALIDALDDKEWPVREHCAEAIGDVGPAAGSQAVAALIGATSDSVVRVRRDAVRSLGKIGTPALEAVPDIQKLIVRDAAKAAVKAIAPEQD